MKFPYLLYSIYKTCGKQYNLRFVEKPDVYIPFNMNNAYIGFVLAKLMERFYLEKWWKELSPEERMLKALPGIERNTREVNEKTIHLTPDEIDPNS